MKKEKEKGRKKKSCQIGLVSDSRSTLLVHPYKKTNKNTKVGKDQKKGVRVYNEATR